MEAVHRQALDDATSEDERWETLAGHLYDPASTRDLCPDEIVEVVAAAFAFTTQARLFRLLTSGRVSERSCSANGQFDIVVQGVRWQPRARALMRRIFPEVLHGEYSLEDGQEAWMEHLAPRQHPDDTPIIHRETFEVGGKVPSTFQ